jgi:hypothetical protein
MKRRLERAIQALLVLNVIAVALLLTIVVVYSLQAGQPGHPTQSEPSPSASSSPELMSMGLAHIPTSNSCLLCHESGGSAGLKPVPAIGHPLEGWRRCATCHTDESLGRTAPGHTGIPEEECLNCHRVAPTGPAITRPHSLLADQKCLDCHGSYAHLPSSMVGRNEDECWLCHQATDLPPPEYPHLPNPDLSCTACHKSPEIGNLPIDHALRSDSTCLLCHDIKRVPAPSVAPAPSAVPAG